MEDIKSNNQKELDYQISLFELVTKFKGLFFYILSKWKIIILTGFLGAGLGFTLAYFQKPTYKALLTFALEDDKSSGGGGGLSGALGLASSLGFDLGSSAGGAFSGANLIEFMQSRLIVERALLNTVVIDGKATTLADYYLDFTKLRASFSEKPKLNKIHYNPGESRLSYSLQKDSLLGVIFKKTVQRLMTVEQRDKKVGIIYVEVKTVNEQFSKNLCEFIVKEVADFYITTKSKKARNNVAILQKQVDSIRNELNRAITGVAEASDNTFNLNQAMIIKRTPSSTKQVDVQANTAILTQLVTNLELAKVTLLKETPLIQIIDRPILPLEKENFGMLKGLIVGGILSGFLVVCYFVFSKVLKRYFRGNKFSSE